MAELCSGQFLLYVVNDLLRCAGFLLRRRDPVLVTGILLTAKNGAKRVRHIDSVRLFFLRVLQFGAYIAHECGYAPRASVVSDAEPEEADVCLCKPKSAISSGSESMLKVSIRTVAAVQW